ncbi:MAG: DUF2059 domain-containing protein [Burkholderiaceae bacterium]|nr:DUF2059 domain-containing protein [Burkholderiaceae bacterium]
MRGNAQIGYAVGAAGSRRVGDFNPSNQGLKMKKILVAIFLSAVPFLCHAAEPSQESIEKLLTVTQTQKLVEQMIPQMEDMMKSVADKEIDAQKLPPEKSAKAKTLSASITKKMTAILREQLSWDNLKKIYIPIYRDSFTQEEVDGLIAFYSSPAGNALIAKMPVVMQKSMAAMQQLIVPMMQEMQKATAQAVEEMKKQAEAK